MTTRTDTSVQAVLAHDERRGEERREDPVASSHARRGLEALYRSQAGRLLRFFSRRSNPQDSADLVQETFTRFAHATLEKEIKPDSPERYLTKMAVNLMHEQGRSPAHRAMQGSLQIDEVALAGPDEQKGLEARDLLARLDTIMMMLKPLTRDIYIARRYHGLSRAEIAAQTGLSLKAIDKQLARAVKHIDHHLGAYDEA